MSRSSENSDDAITEEEISGKAEPGHTSICDPEDGKKRNAFAELMTSSKKPKQHLSPPKPQTSPYGTSFHGRNALGAYLASPTSFPPSVVIYHNETFIALNDLYPKSSIHILLLPRLPTKTFLHPFLALSDPPFLALCLAEVAKARTLVASELRRKFGKFSASEAARSAAMEASPPPAELPSGRDLEREVLAGVHAGPSMNHLHIHVLSRDRFSERMKHRKHYNSFATPFLVGLEEFPLAEGDVRRQKDRGGYLRENLKCWRCGKGFGGDFVGLKRHLGDEFEEWKRE